MRPPCPPAFGRVNAAITRLNGPKSTALSTARVGQAWAGWGGRGGGHGQVRTRGSKSIFKSVGRTYGRLMDGRLGGADKSALRIYMERGKKKEKKKR